MVAAGSGNNQASGVFLLETVFRSQLRDALSVSSVRRKRFRRNLFEPDLSACDRRIPFGRTFHALHQFAQLSAHRLLLFFPGLRQIALFSAEEKILREIKEIFFKPRHLPTAYRLQHFRTNLSPESMARPVGGIQGFVQHSR